MPDLPLVGLAGLAAMIAAGFAWQLALFFRVLRAERHRESEWER
jgi:hypothetical protein